MSKKIESDSMVPGEVAPLTVGHPAPVDRVVPLSDSENVPEQIQRARSERPRRNVQVPLETEPRTSRISSRPAAPPPCPLRDAGGKLGRNSGRGRVLFFDPIGGFSGDMCVASLLDLGVPGRVLSDAIEALPITGYSAVVAETRRGAIRASTFTVEVHTHQPARDYAEIRSLLAAAPLAPDVRALAQDVFLRLARAEADVHGTSLEAVHFHEVGAVDSIVDIVCACAAIAHLGAEVTCGPLPIGRGMTASEHGPLPLPAPATVTALRGVPTYGVEEQVELVTPTGACLAATFARHFASWPSFAPDAVGWGAGSRDLLSRPNVLRAVLGDPAHSSASTSSNGDYVVLETNVDDTSAEIAGHTVDRAMTSGALDAWCTPIVMKKNRPAVLISVLARQQDAERLGQLLLAETPTLGVRLTPVSRVERPRRSVTVATRFGELRVKIADGDGLATTVSPEFEDARAAAATHGVPLREVMAEAIQMFHAGRTHE